MTGRVRYGAHPLESEVIEIEGHTCPVAFNFTCFATTASVTTKKEICKAFIESVLNEDLR